ncbi:Endoplasmic reticulum-Golgi intermediate compartment protein 3 [Tetrabaena socialis]|uniref:Endoplasmic reticulum-Golgi intermediate compartment protein 3 n=1 Tax=Tetrabaena socialis TaxID=47790 RepID=A0A2J7ZR82_9CHLO|nr:Endoplasmic reticulum-Golgi intermediate compartment protein 3 [Tetrabaena socialis]|eukprot:PNH02779.1 Endoplasmic reticulum-Golgi intermediate compartment protein 3 [Tetrabaena socialis]
MAFPKVPCSWLSLDAMDISGELHLDLDHDVYKQRLAANGSPVKEVEKHNVDATKTKMPAGNGTAGVAAGVAGDAANDTQVAVSGCGSCYGAEDQQGDCCNTCDEVRAAYRRKGWALANVDHVEQCAHDMYTESIKEQAGEGCHMWGMLEVNKVAGNFHFAPGRSYQQGSMHVHDIAPFGEAVMDFRHTVHRLSFGKPFPGMKNPLDTAKAEHTAATTSGMFQYFLKVVPTAYTDLSNVTVNTNQFSVTENFREAQGGAGKTLPGVFFFYDLSPIKVRIIEHASSFLSFLTSVCAIVGGVFTVSGIVDACVYTGARLIKKKMELGKFS